MVACPRVAAAPWRGARTAQRQRQARPLGAAWTHVAGGPARLAPACCAPACRGTAAADFGMNALQPCILKGQQLMTCCVRQLPGSPTAAAWLVLRWPSCVRSTAAWQLMTRCARRLVGAEVAFLRVSLQRRRWRGAGH